MTRKNTEVRTRIKPHTSLITKKVRMERLQWGFPIATVLSLIRPASINGKEKEMTHPAQWMGLKTMWVDSG